MSAPAPTVMPAKALVGRLATENPDTARCHLAFDGHTVCGTKHHAKLTTEVTIHTPAAVTKARLCARCFTPALVDLARTVVSHRRPWNERLDNTLFHIANALRAPQPAPEPVRDAPLTLAQMAALFATNHPVIPRPTSRRPVPVA